MQLPNLTQLPNTNIRKRKTLILAVINAVLVLSSIGFASLYLLQLQRANTFQQELARQHTNAKIVDFLNLFIEKVLKANGEVSFEDRLKLENAVRGLNDPDLLAKWEKFTGATSEAQIQQGVQDLLESLVKRITTQ